jgi:CubicO group peptidase (beta-lactamase class C family)
MLRRGGIAMADGSRRIGVFPALLACVLAACGGGGDASGPPALPAPPSPSAGTLGDGRLAELVEWARDAQDVPAMGVIIIRGGQVAERAVVGLRSADGGAAATVEDRWHMGSITKSMTSTLAALLVEDGLISWDTKPLDVWPELANDIHPDFRNATLRQFLSHTSGMKRDDDWSGAADSASGSAMQKRHEWARRLLSRAPEFANGTWSYSNMGYVVAGAMLETRTNTAWETLLTTRVFVPLGMTHSGFGAPGTPGQLDQPLGHWSRGSGFDPVPVGAGADNWIALGPAGTVHTTLDDFTHYLQAHLDGARGMPGLLTTDSFDTLHAPVASDYALGWGVSGNLSPLGAAGFSHNGSNLRWFALTWFSPQKNAGLLIVLNGGGDRGFAAMSALDALLRQRIAVSP